MQPPVTPIGDSPQATASSSAFPQWMRKLALFACVVGMMMAGYCWMGNRAAFERLAAHEAAFRDYYLQHPLLVLGAAFLLYTLVTGFSIPGALFLSIAYAWFFRFWIAVPLISFASTTGATIAFLTSRYLLRNVVQTRLGTRMQAVNESFEREGALYLFTLRLIPALPFFLVNLLMGLTNIKTSTYWWASQLGMLPGTIVFAWAGDSLAESVPTLADLAKTDLSGILTLRVWTAFLLLAAFPYIARGLIRWWRHRTTRD